MYLENRIQKQIFYSKEIRKLVKLGNIQQTKAADATAASQGQAKKSAGWMPRH